MHDKFASGFIGLAELFCFCALSMGFPSHAEPWAEERGGTVEGQATTICDIYDGRKHHIILHRGASKLTP